MSADHEKIQVKWPTDQNSISVSAGSTQESEAFSLHDSTAEAMVVLQVDNDGASPTSGDTMDVWLLPTSGDPDGGAGDEYDTPEHAQHIALLDTDAEDPARRHYAIPTACKGGKLRVKNNAASNGITISAIIMEVRT